MLSGHVPMRGERGAEKRLEGVVRGRGGPELLDVLRAHPREEIEALRVVRRDAGDDRGRLAALRQQRGAREGVRAAARPAGREEAVDPELSRIAATSRQPRSSSASVSGGNSSGAFGVPKWNTSARRSGGPCRMTSRSRPSAVRP